MSVAAPVAGTILPAATATPAAGMMVNKGQQIFRLLPTRRDAAKQKLDRAEQLLRDKAGSVRQVEEAAEQLRLAESALKAANERMTRVTRSPLEADVTVGVPSPEGGMLQKIHVGAGQKVAASTPLFEVASLRTIWIRVPVYVGDLSAIDQREPARVQNIGDEAGSSVLLARPIAAPPSANPNAATADLYFQLPAARGFRPGQRVEVTQTLRGTHDNLVVPDSSIVRDIHGGEWVYESVGPQQYRRRRVEVRYVNGDQAVLARGPAAGAQVVVVGAAELFSTEFSTGK
jgi:multidrug efflux pump subunit AcrA (membrane-fusion protein)